MKLIKVGNYVMNVQCLDRQDKEKCVYCVTSCTMCYISKKDYICFALGGFNGP
jgi:hypothetical protein